MNALFAWLWQGAAIALATSALLASMRRLNAATRHAIWWCALGAVLATPVVRAATSAAVQPSAVGVDAAPSRVVVLPAPPDWVIAVVIGAWLGTLLVGAFKTGTALRLLARLKSESRPLEAARQQRLPMWRTIELPLRPELRVSRGAGAASALGLRRPVILVSDALVDALSDEELDQVVMHEYAHLLRHDDWLRLIESVIVSIAGLHPAVRLIARQIDLEREAACDDMVVSRTGGARAYATCLAEAAAIARKEGSHGGRHLMRTAPPATGSGVSLRVRVLRLLDPRRARTARLAPAAVAVALLTVAAAMTLSHHVAPVLIADRTSAPSVPPAPQAIVARMLPAGAVVPDVALKPGAAPRTAADARRSDTPRLAPSALPAQASSGQLAPSEIVGTLPAASPDAVPAPLASSSFAAGVHAPVAVANMPNLTSERRDASLKWSSLGAPGVAVGRGAKSIAGFFGGAAKAVATSF